MRCGVVLSVLEDVRAQWRQLISLEPQDVSSLLITTSMIFAESLPFEKLPKDLLNKILEEARWLRVVELLEPLPSRPAAAATSTESSCSKTSCCATSSPREWPSTRGSHDDTSFFV